MDSIKSSLEDGNNVYLRGFGSFIVKKRAEKTARNISKNTTLIIPEHFIPSFKPAKTFVGKVKTKVKNNQLIFTNMPSGKKRKRHKMATHKRKKRLRKNRHKRRNNILF
jgi:DNA-binding protein HU-beta